MSEVYPDEHYGWRSHCGFRQTMTSVQSNPTSDPTHKALIDADATRVYDYIHDAVVALRSDGQIVFASRSCKAVLGYEPDELIGISAFDLVHPDDVPAGLERFTAAVAKPGKTQQLVYRLRHKRGHWIDCQSTGICTHDLADEPLTVITSRDVTEARALLFQQRLLSTTVESAANGVVITDTEGHIIWANAAFTKLTGYSLDEVIGRSPRMLKSGRHDDAFYADLWQTIKAGKTWRGELVNRRKDGSYYTEDMTITPVSTNDETITHYIAIKQDITAHRAAEDGVRRSREQLDSILNSVDVGVALIDRDMRVLNMNRKMRQWYPDRGAGNATHCYARLNIDRPDPCAQCPTLSTFADGGRHERITQRVTAQGMRHLRIISCPVHDENDQVVAATEIIEDITERVEAEKFRAQRKALAASIKSMEQVLGVVSHELRTPIAAVRATAEMLLDESVGLDAETEQQFLNSIHSEVLRMARMVDDLLETARLNSGRAQWQWGKVRLDDVCRQAFDLVRHAVDPERVKFDWQVEPADLMINGDADALVRLTANLATNAAKNTSDGSIDITACRHDANAVVLTVADTGCGIPEHVAEHLGQPFALNAGLIGAQHVKGAGLGLSICKGIVAAHGGSIRVTTRRHEGTRIEAFLRTDLPAPNQVNDKAVAVNVADDQFRKTA